MTSTFSSWNMTVNFRFSISVLFVENVYVENLENRPFKIDMDQVVCACVQYDLNG